MLRKTKILRLATCMMMLLVMLSGCNEYNADIAKANADASVKVAEIEAEKAVKIAEIDSETRIIEADKAANTYQMLGVMGIIIFLLRLHYKDKKHKRECMMKFLEDNFNNLSASQKEDILSGRSTISPVGIRSISGQ